MSSERKNAFLGLWFGVPDGVHWAHGMSNEVERGVSDCFDQAIAAWETRPAPAATDTGLVTVGYMNPHNINTLLDGFVDHGMVWLDQTDHFSEPVVTRSQAEELLAAERARYVEASQRATNEESLKDTMHRGLLRWKNKAEFLAEKVSDLVDKIAAKDTRIEELEKERDHWKEYSSGQGKLIESGVFVTNEEYVRLIALEAKLADAEKALEDVSGKIGAFHAASDDDAEMLNIADIEQIIRSKLEIKP